MKSKFVYIAFLFAFLFCATAQAQMVDRSVGQSQYKRGKKKGEKKDFIQITVEYYTKELSLDDFQVAAVKEVLEEQKTAITNLSTQQGITDEERKDKANAINDKIDGGIKPLLSPDQLKKYEALQEKRKKQ
jgi:hypothetical protein